MRSFIMSPIQFFAPGVVLACMAAFSAFGAPPAITAFSPGAAAVGDTVTVAGNNFSPNAASNVVYFGAVRAQVAAASSTSLTVTVPPGATYAPITVTLDGLTAYASAAFVPSFDGKGAAIDTGSFSPRADLSADNGPIQVVIADLDGDGKPDLVLANAYDHRFSVYRNVSTDGSLAASAFAPRVSWAFGSGTDNPLHLAVADLDGDGNLDLIVPDSNVGTVVVYRNLSAPGTLTTNSFASGVGFPVGASPRTCAIADLDGDGRPEILTANVAGDSISILQNLSTPGTFASNSFAPRFELPAGDGAVAVAIADLDGDGLPDLAVVSSDSGFASVYRNLGSPGGLSASSFDARVDVPAMNGSIHIAAGDLDGDGKPELIFGSYQSATVAVCHNLASPGALTTDSFAPRVEFPLPGRFHNVVLGDLNGDAKPDLVVDCEIESVLSVFQNQSVPGSFTTTSLASRVDYATGYNAWGVAVGDLNGDGRPDIALANAYGPSVSVYRNLLASPPVILSQPEGTAITVGSNATFNVTAGGTAPFGYQWIFHNTNIAGATNASLTLSNVPFSQAGNYSVQVTNAFGSAISSNALLTVNYPPAPVIVGSTSVASGGNVTVPISLVANGIENSLGFSLNFDPTFLAYAGATLDSGAPGAVLFPNTSFLIFINSGKLGLAVALPPGATFAPGTQQVVRVSFVAAVFTGENISTAISLGDQPTPRQLWDPEFLPLAATWSDGTVTITPATAFEGDAFPRPNGDLSATLIDWLQMGRYVARLSYPTNAAEFQRADCAPRSQLGDGEIKATDWVQAGRYAAGLDPLTLIGGPTNEFAVPAAGPSASRRLTLGTATLNQGETGAISVTLAAQGNENALSFSLTFDPALVSFAGTSLGSGAAGATLHVNTNQIASGMLGFALSLGSGSTLVAGSKELVRVSFQPLPLASGNFPPAFADQPVPREISDVAALALPASYVNGTITVIAQPALRIAQSGPNVLLTWPLWATNFTLQEAAALPPSGSWTNLSVTPGISNNESAVTLPVSGLMKYYRLKN